MYRWSKSWVVGPILGSNYNLGLITWKKYNSPLDATGKGSRWQFYDYRDGQTGYVVVKDFTIATGDSGMWHNSRIFLCY